MYPLLALINIGALALVLGNLVEVALVEIPAFRHLPQENFAHIHSTLDKHIDRYMPITTILAAVTALAEILFVYSGWSLLSVGFGVLSLVAVAVISQFLNVPLNRQIRAWNTNSPINLSEIRARWIRFHYARTIAGFMGFMLIVIPLAIHNM